MPVVFEPHFLLFHSYKCSLSHTHTHTQQTHTQTMVAYSDMLKECQQLQLSSYVRDVNYSCGACGYELNLNSRNRNTCSTSVIDSKSIKRGIISFFSVDESRFTQIQLFHWPSWIPFFNSKRQRTKLLCRSCGNYLGFAYTLPSQSWDGISDHSRIYDIKLTSLLPSFCEEPTQRLDDITKFQSSSSTVVF